MVWHPPLPPNLSPHLVIAGTSLVLTVRTLMIAEPVGTSGGGATSLTGLSLRSRLGNVFAPPPPTHDESDQRFVYRGQEVVVREKARVESQDPSLMAVMAKLSALGHSVKGWRRKVQVVMGEEGEEEE